MRHETKEAPQFTHNGRFTARNRGTGEHRTFRVHTQPANAKFAPLARVVGLLTGPDNGADYTGFGFVTADGIRVWGSKRAPAGAPPNQYEKYAAFLWSIVVEGPRSRYAGRYEIMAETVCRACNRALTEPGSIQSGIGPVCGGRA